ncbi:MAG: hypothetical protein DDG60_03485 [Anaerolineae bacterium]|nr:MAG: hypothetical protein DDG60_03485 [Anaerolineae bacterium]
MRKRAFLTVLTLFVLLAVIVTPVLAFDERGGEEITIGAEEVIEDDLYVMGQTITLNGTIKGDLVAAASVITINGTVEGDLIAAGQAIIIKGTIRDDARLAAGAILLDEKATIGSDLIAAGGSLETKVDSSVAQDVIFTGGQARLAGQITRNLKIGVGGAELLGKVGGNANITAGDPKQEQSGPLVFLPDSPIPLPNVGPGLKIDPQAKIEGTLEYVSPHEIPLPSGIAGRVQRLEPAIAPQEETIPHTPAERFISGLFDMLRNLVSLFLVGLALVGLFPRFMQANAEQVRTAPLPAFGWGIVSWAAFFFSITLIVVTMLVGGLTFGILTLNRLSAAIVWTGVLLLFLLILGFVLSSTFLAKIIVALIGGQLLLQRLKPEWAEHRIWPLLLGVTLFALLAAIPMLGNLVNILAILLGLGALWLYGYNRFKKEQTAQQPLT